MIVVLLAAAGLTLLTGDLAAAVVIALVVVVNTTAGVVRSPYRTSLTVLHRAVVQPIAVVGHRVRGRLHGRGRLRASTAGHLRDCVAATGQLAITAPFPVIIWGADELVRWAARHRNQSRVLGSQRCNRPT